MCHDTHRNTKQWFSRPPLPHPLGRAAKSPSDKMPVDSAESVRCRGHTLQSTRLVLEIDEPGGAGSSVEPRHIVINISKKMTKKQLSANS